MSSSKTKTNRLKVVWKKTNGVCAHCGKAASGTNRTIDHFIPRSKGGTFDMRNLIPLCKDCNKAKSNYKVDPLIYYSHISECVLDMCLRYEQEFIVSHSNAEGHIFYNGSDEYIPYEEINV